MDPATGAFLGNTTLLFSHAEYFDAVLEIARTTPLEHAALMASQVLSRLRRLVPRGHD